jgi:hypothetical protein
MIKPKLPTQPHNAPYPGKNLPAKFNDWGPILWLVPYDGAEEHITSKFWKISVSFSPWNIFPILPPKLWSGNYAWNFSPAPSGVSRKSIFLFFAMPLDFFRKTLPLIPSH